jgi:hypothetical protein
MLVNSDTLWARLHVLVPTPSENPIPALGNGWSGLESRLLHIAYNSAIGRGKCIFGSLSTLVLGHDTAKLRIPLLREAGDHQRREKHVEWLEWMMNR